MKISKKEAASVGLKIVSFAGEARSNLINAFNLLTQKKVKEADKLFELATQNLTDAHREQTELITKEAAGHKVEYSFILSHGQDILMTTYILRDFYEIFKKTLKLK